MNPFLEFATRSAFTLFPEGYLKMQIRERVVQLREAEVLESVSNKCNVKDPSKPT